MDLIWDEERGVGYYPVKSPVYGREYWEKYQGYAKTPMGDAITAARVLLVSRHLKPEELLVDVGIGDGSFIKARPNTYGEDINPWAIQWMKDNGKLINPNWGAENYSFWDSLEHFSHPEEAVAKVRNMCFVSIPTFRGREHVLKSKHYRKDEHYWYFTATGLVDWFNSMGLARIAANTWESHLGREDISTFVFKRRTT